jgi:hypothetical protein
VRVAGVSDAGAGVVVAALFAEEGRLVGVCVEAFLFCAKP